MKSSRQQSFSHICLVLLLGVVGLVAAVEHGIQLLPVQNKYIYATYQTGQVFAQFTLPIKAGFERTNYKLTITNGTYSEDVVPVIPEAEVDDEGKPIVFPIYTFVRIPKQMEHQNTLTLTYDIANKSTGQVFHEKSTSVMPVIYHGPYSDDDQATPEPRKPSSKGDEHQTPSGSDVDNGNEHNSTGHESDNKGDNDQEPNNEQGGKPIDKDSENPQEETKPKSDENAPNGVFETVGLHKIILAACASSLALLWA